MNSKSDRAPIIAPPPLIGLACIALAFVAQRFKPLPLFSTGNFLQITLGIVLIVLSIVTVVSARRVMIANGTHPNPYQPTKAIAMTGVYRFSRNPIYIAFLVLVLAFTLLANSLWFVVFAG